MTLNGPDPHAIDIAQAVQKEAGQATVILFGSRATGRYRQNSDLDLLVVTDENPVSAELRACHAARIYMKAHPPRLELNVIGMNPAKIRPLPSRQPAYRRTSHPVRSGNERRKTGLLLTIPKKSAMTAILTTGRRPAGVSKEPKPGTGASTNSQTRSILTRN